LAEDAGEEEGGAGEGDAVEGVCAGVALEGCEEGLFL
jgi:hypothetical protein